MDKLTFLETILIQLFREMRVFTLSIVGELLKENLLPLSLKMEIEDFSTASE